MTMVFRFSVVVCLGLIACIEILGAAEDTGTLSGAAVKRTRKSVRMLDDVYKTTIVLITDKYVDDKDDFPAGGAAVEWFKQISEKGWHEVRLLDATGSPEESANVAKDDFERQGIKSLKVWKRICREGRKAKRQVP